MTSRWWRGAAAACILALAGCESSTGLLIEVTRDDTVPARLGRLVFHIGVDGMAGGPARFVDPDPEEDIRLEGRDVGADPYRLLLRPRDYADAQLKIAVVAYAGGEVVGFGELADTVGFVDGEVARWRIELTSQTPDGFEVTETGCVTWFEDGERVAIGQPRDKDCDGWTEEDCDDLDPRVNPGAGERCGNSVDEDCDEQIDEDVDEDGDLVTTCDGDCNDGDSAIFPGAEERCDGVDNDCNDACDENEDADGDDFTSCGSRIVDGGAACVFDAERADCDDFDADVNPDAAEVCDGIDNDCNDVCDDSRAGLDGDGDGFTACGSIADRCGRSELLVDCQDEDPLVHPAAAELCNGRDDDCDGELLAQGPCFATGADTICYYGERECAEQPGDPGDWAAPCVAIEDPVLNPAPDAACTAYADCAAEPEDPDPHTCSLEASGLPIVPCGVRYEIAANAQCGRPEVELPTDELIDCSWRVVGGVQQGDYEVGLRPIDLPDATPEPQLAVCGAVLVVTSRVAGPPSPLMVLLARTDDLLLTTFYAALLAPDLVEECDPDGGLACAAFP
jgi:hypothetical protein